MKDDKALMVKQRMDAFAQELQKFLVEAKMHHVITSASMAGCPIGQDSFVFTLIVEPNAGTIELLETGAKIVMPGDN